MAQAKKLIEVAMPIREISVESIRDKNIRNGHLSTLHKWWARRPLPVCQAVIFASLIPDPLDKNCPRAFCDAVELLLGSERMNLNEVGIPQDAYKPYDDIPYTAATDKMYDNLRNRLLMFIGKYSVEYCQNEKKGKVTSPGKLLSYFSLIKWENKKNDLIINKARKLIWVAHNSTCDPSKSVDELLHDFEHYYNAIILAEKELYSTVDRHIVSKDLNIKEDALYTAIEAFYNKMPIVFDPFAGGGAIPLEAARLGCRSYGNDINPVAHIIEKGSVEFPQKYGKPITFSKEEFIRIYGQNVWNAQTNEKLIFYKGEAIAIQIPNQLSFDVEYYANKLIQNTENEIGQFYPEDENGLKPIAYYWSKIGTCSNPTCKAQVPLLRNFYLSKKINNEHYLEPIIKGNFISFKIKRGRYDESIEGWNKRGNLKCPCCGSITDVKIIKQQQISGILTEKIIAVIVEGKIGKEYRLPSKAEIEILDRIPIVERPNEKMQRNSAGGDTFSWGITEWGQMYSARQLVAMNSLVKSLDFIKKEIVFQNQDYKNAILVYLAMWIDRISTVSTKFSVWNNILEIFQTCFGRQAISMVFDYPEANPFSNIGGGSYWNQLEHTINYINFESSTPFYSIIKNSASGEKSQFPNKYLNAVVTDPPYYDAIAYADLSDFFYVWLKRSLGDIYPLVFSTPQTPKSEECTALKHHHNGNADNARKHFENKLTQIFDSIEHQTSDIISIMFAHQSTDAWTTLCNSIINSRMNITGSWAIDTEVDFALKNNKGFLSSSVTVSSKPALKNGLGNFKIVKKAIENTVNKEVGELYKLGFRGADLLTACFGQAVSEFGKYEKVEKADGSEVTVAELLEMARESAFNALLKGFDGDEFTKFYIGWLQLYSFAESEFDDAAKFSRVGLSINVAELFTEHILIKNGNKQTLGTFEERIKANKNIGDRANNFLIDLVHRAMALYKGNNRTALLQYIGKVAAQPESNFWRVVTSLCEVLPAGSEDHKQALGLLTNKDSLIRESKTVQTATTTQTNLFES